MYMVFRIYCRHETNRGNDTFSERIRNLTKQLETANKENKIRENKLEGTVLFFNQCCFGNILKNNLYKTLPSFSQDV